MKTYNKGASFEITHGHTYNHKRNIPFYIMLKIWIGNPLSFIGLFFFLFGLPFSFVFVAFSDLFSPGFSEKDPIAIGKITESIPTNSYINDVRVYEYIYQFKIDDERLYTGKGYSTGNSQHTGDEISIVYKTENPEKSKATELRTSEFNAGIGLITLIFPLIGLIMMFFSTRKAIRQILILQVGNLAEGKLLYKEPTNVQINKQTVYAFTFEFKASDNNIYKAIAKTHKYYRLEDETLEKLIYDPDKPENAVLLDELPNGIKNYFLNL